MNNHILRSSSLQNDSSIPKTALSLWIIILNLFLNHAFSTDRSINLTLCCYVGLVSRLNGFALIFLFCQPVEVVVILDVTGLYKPGKVGFNPELVVELLGDARQDGGLERCARHHFVGRIANAYVQGRVLLKLDPWKRSRPFLGLAVHHVLLNHVLHVSIAPLNRSLGR
jgi:hypothetical protein